MQHACNLVNTAVVDDGLHVTSTLQTINTQTLKHIVIKLSNLNKIHFGGNLLRIENVVLSGFNA